MDNLEEMDRVLEKFNLPRLNQKEIEIMSNPIRSTEIKAVIKSLLINKSPGLDGFTGEFYQTLEKSCIFPGGSDDKASAYSAGDPGLIPGWGRSSGEGNGNPLQYSCLENLMDGGAW